MSHIKTGKDLKMKLKMVETDKTKLKEIIDKL